VGPGVWNEWKRVLLTTLFDVSEERLRLGHKQRGRAELVEERKQQLIDSLGWKKSAGRAYVKRLHDSYWLAEPAESQLANARQVASVEAQILDDIVPRVSAEDDRGSGATRVSVYAPDREGLFYRICAGLAAAGASIIDARIHTTRDGMALDNLLVQDGQGRAYADRRLKNRLIRAVETALSSTELPSLPRSPSQGRAAAFRVAPSVMVAEKASTRTTVVEVNARDRPALLARLAGTIHECGHIVHSAHIATYGERAVDVFYLTAADGRKLNGEQIEHLRTALVAAAGETAEAAAA
jgi:[protein-PII] uridylyltransferase